MAQHVDVVKRLSSPEALLGRVVRENGHVVFQSPDRDYWRRWLTEITRMDPDEDPDAFLSSLAERLEGTYVYATEPHEDHECPYAGQIVMGLESSHAARA